jgi:hypothetical protein
VNKKGRLYTVAEGKVKKRRAGSECNTGPRYILYLSLCNHSLQLLTTDGSLPLSFCHELAVRGSNLLYLESVTTPHQA